MRRWPLLAVMLGLSVLPGCIVLDQLTTVTIRPDGSADAVVFNSSVRSTEEGAKAAEELRRYAESFDARTSDDLTRITKAGGALTEVRWLRREPPYSTVVTARFPDASALEKAATIEDDKGKVVVASRFSRDGAKRRLTMTVLPPRNLDEAQLQGPSASQARQEQANGLNATRIVVVGGRITSARGWTVSDDRQSALLALDEVRGLLRGGPERVDLFVEWEVEEAPTGK